jgi:hypothetical protein
MERFGMRSAPGFRMSAEVSAKGVTAFLQRVYGWIFAGLAITVLGAFMVAGSPTLLRYIWSNQCLVWEGSKTASPRWRSRDDADARMAGAQDAVLFPSQR